MEIRPALRLAYRIAVFVLGSLLLSLIVFVLVLAGPIWVVMAIGGRQQLMDAPGHGGAIVFVTGPLAVGVASIFWPIMGSYIFGRFRNSS